MAATWITIAAPYVPEIIRLARPLFTRTPVVLDLSHLPGLPSADHVRDLLARIPAPHRPHFVPALQALIG